MKINITKLVNGTDKPMLLHVILEAMTHTLQHEKFMQFMSPRKTADGYIVDIKLMADDVELNLEAFINHWQSQVHRMIKDEATTLATNKFRDVEDLVSDLSERLKKEIEQRLENWEKEEISPSNDQTITLKTSVIRRTIHTMDDILKLPNNSAAITKIKLMRTELNDYLPETLTLEQYETSSK